LDTTYSKINGVFRDYTLSRGNIHSLKKIDYLVIWLFHPAMTFLP